MTSYQVRWSNQEYDEWMWQHYLVQQSVVRDFPKLARLVKTHLRYLIDAGFFTSGLESINFVTNTFLQFQTIGSMQNSRLFITV